MQSSGKSNIPGYTRGNTSYNKEKERAVELEEKETSKDPMEKVTNMIKNWLLVRTKSWKINLYN